MTLFRPFTQESLAAIEERIANQTAGRAEQARLKERSPHRDQRLEPYPALDAGKPLSRQLARDFPPELIGTPIEDLDKYYENEKTFMIVSKGKDIFRFSATDSMFMLSPFNPLRRVAIYILVHPAFSFLVIVTILLNCMLMTMPSNYIIDSSEIIFIAIYTAETCIKVVARGFILEKFTYLRNPWNWLEFIVIVLAYVTMGVELGNFSALRTFRVLRVLKAVAILPGLKTIVNSIIESVKNLRDFIILTFFFLSVFALLSLQIYMGVLTQKCVRDPIPALNMSWEMYVSNYSHTKENWILENDDYILCGNSTGTRRCPVNSTCVQGVGPNPNYGYTTFDSFPWALLSAFRLMTQDFWESLYRMVLKAAGPWHMCVFVVIIIFSSFYLRNLILALVAMSYYELQKKAEEEKVAIAAEESSLRAATAEVTATEAKNTIDSIDSEDCLKKKQSSSPDPNRQTDVNMKERGHLEETRFKEQCLKNCLKFIDIFCTWNFCIWWIRFREIVGLVVFDPFMELFINLCIIGNTFFMAMDYYVLGESSEDFFNYGNNFFTITFALEAGFKIIALSPRYYFCKGWNIFDFIIVVLSLLDIEFGSIQGLSILRSIRLLRILRLAKQWPTLSMLISIIWKTMGAFANLTFVLVIIVFIYAAMGMQLFGKYYDENKHLFKHGIVPNWNFKDFMHSFMIVFRVLCGEWIESMWDCLLVAGWTCIPFFLSAVVIGNIVVMNLFLAMLLSSFGAYTLPRGSSDTEYTNDIQKAIQRCACAKNWIKKFVLQCIGTKPTNHIAGQPPEMMRKETFEALKVETMESDSRISGDELDSKTHSVNSKDIIAVRYPAECCSDCCYARSPCLKKDESKLWIPWNNAREKCFILVQHIYFETLIISMIFISSTALAAEDVYLKYRPWPAVLLQYLDKVLALLFLFEMLLKWLAFGFKKYFANAWCRLDFLIVFVTMFNLVMSFAGLANIPAFKTMRMLRVLRLVSVMSRMERTKVVIQAMVQAIPAIFNVLFVCLIFWLIFAIMGVQLMGGQFYSCQDFDNNRINATIMPNRTLCLHHNLTWANRRINFDNVLNAYLALFQVATFNGWIDIMNDAIDCTGVEQQPESEANIYIYIYFVCFIIFGSFFTLNLFIGVIIDNLNEQKRKMRGVLEMFMTGDQKKYYKTAKMMGLRKPTKAIPRPQFKLQAVVFDLTTNKKFDMAIMILICLNMTVMCLDHYNSTERLDTILEYINIFFIAIFTAECVLKIFALRTYYFKEPWTVFDLIVVTLSILGIILNDLIEKYFISPTLLRVVRVVKVGRILRLVKAIRGIRTLLFTIAMPLSVLFNICILLFLVMFIYAIFGMSFFMNVRNRAGVDQNFNFETFGQSMILLFQMSTSAGWDSVLAAIMEEDDCKKGEDGDCGSRNIAVAYLVSYLIISYFIIINMYIAVILGNYSEAREAVLEGLTEDDYDMYYTIWQKFDPKATQFIQCSVLGTFLDTLEEPLRIPKPNKYEIISMEIPIYENHLVFCKDILYALTKDFFKRKGCYAKEYEELKVVLGDTKACNPISSTMKRQRELYAARVLQSAWRRYKGNLCD